MGSARRVERAGFWTAVFVAIVAGVFAVLLAQRAVARGKVDREDAALEAVRLVLREAEAYRREAGRFGWLEELGAAKPLRLPVVPGPQGLEARTEGYRIQVLLPTGRSASGQVLLAPSGATFDPLLAARHVAVVARPLVPGEDGYRAFYLDETGRVFVQEGAVDGEGLRENALPRARIEKPTGAESPGAVWRLLDDLDRNP
jgi:hypothetical protein